MEGRQKHRTVINIQHTTTFKEAIGFHNENLICLLEWYVQCFGKQGSTKRIGTNQWQVQILFAFCYTRKETGYFLLKETLYLHSISGLIKNMSQLYDQI